MTERRIVVVDVETSALEPQASEERCPWGEAIEVAWWDMSTGECGSFIPSHNRANVRAYGEPQALIVSRYLERIAMGERDIASPTDIRALYDRIDGATLAGCNPAFDAKFLAPLFNRYCRQNDAGWTPRPWHHRMLDLSAYYAGHQGTRGNGVELLGLADIAAELKVPVKPDHTAMNDVLATGECLIALGACPRLDGSKAP